MRTPVHLISGFLGAGKTTTIQSCMRALGPEERVAVVVNDFGEAALDAEVLAAGAGFEVRRIDGACVCCTAPEGFNGALGALIDETDCTRIFVEPTGLARPADLIDTLARGPHKDRIALGPLVVVVDPAVIASDVCQETALIGAQAAVADVLVANRTDQATPDQLAAFDRWASALWPGPLTIVQTSHGAIDPSLLDWPEGEGPRAQSMRIQRPLEDSTSGFSVQSFVWGPEVVFSRKRLDQLMGRLLRGKIGTRVARSKGVFRTDEGVQRIDIAGQQAHVATSDHRRDSRLDVILHGGAAPPGAWARLGGWLDDAQATPEELQVVAGQVEIVSPGGGEIRLDRTALLALPDGIADISTVIPKRQGQAALLRSLVTAHGLPETGEAIVVAADGYISPPVPVSAMLEGVLLHSLDGDPLPQDKGGPIRLLIPGDAGPAGPCSNVKAVVRLIFR